MSPTRRAALWPLALTLAMLGVALAVLLWLRGELVQGQESVLAGTVRRFEATNVLGRPEDRSLVFEDLETLAQASENEFLRRIHVTKSLIDGAEHTVRPFHADLSRPGWRSEARWTRLPIGAGPDGHLYIDVNNTTIHAVNASIAFLSLLLAGGLGVILFRSRAKEVQLSQTISELQERKAQVVQLERLALVGQLSANIFHDIKKPVLNIKHEVSDAMEGSPTAPDEIFRIVYGQTELYLDMLRDLGIEAFAKAGSEESEWLDVGDAIERSLRLVRYEQSGIRASFDRPPQSMLLKAVPHRLVQLFSNLILNAYQAMGESGELRLVLVRDGDKTTVTVEDSGPGIPPENRDQVFEPFATGRADSGGSGLGLYICRSIVQDMGGTIRIEDSQSLGGARFVIQFPTGQE